MKIYFRIPIFNIIFVPDFQKICPDGGIACLTAA